MTVYTFEAAAFHKIGLNLVSKYLFDSRRIPVDTIRSRSGIHPLQRKVEQPPTAALSLFMKTHMVLRVKFGTSLFFLDTLLPRELNKTPNKRRHIFSPSHTNSAGRQQHCAAPPPASPSFSSASQSFVFHPIYRRRDNYCDH